MIAIRINRVTEDLVRKHEMTAFAAAMLAADLEAAKKWFQRFALVVSRSPIPPAEARAWLIEHGLMTEADDAPVPMTTYRRRG